MSTNTTVLLAAIILGAAIVTSTVIGSRGDETGPAVDVQTPHATTESANGDGPEPTLYAMDPDERVARLERELESARSQIERLSENMAGATPARAEPRPASEHAVMRDRFFELTEAYRSGTATKEEAAELIRLTKDDVFMARVVGQLESHIAENPDDLDVRMQLVDVQSARLHSAGSITERTLLASGMRQQITTVLEKDPEHWRARYSRAVGISHSQRTPQGRATAAREFEALIEIQRAGTAEPRFADTYGQLAQVYMADRQTDKARAALQAGLERHPDDQSLRDQLAKLDSER